MDQSTDSNLVKGHDDKMYLAEEIFNPHDKSNYIDSPLIAKSPKPIRSTQQIFLRSGGRYRNLIIRRV